MELQSKLGPDVERDLVALRDRVNGWFREAQERVKRDPVLRGDPGEH